MSDEAIYPDPGLSDAAVTVTAIRPDKSREEVIAFRPQAGWARLSAHSTASCAAARA